MTHPSHGPSYYAAPGAYGAYSHAPQTGSDDNRARARRYLSAAVVVLGLATYLVSFGPMSEAGRSGWEVRFSVLAAVIAGLTLLARQTPRNWLVVPFAVAGFLDALAASMTATAVGWALIVIVALNGLQAVAALAAVFNDTNGGRDVHDASAAYVAAYPYYAAYQAYFAAQQPQEAMPTAQAHAAGAADAQAQQSYEDLQARYAQYADYVQQQGYGGSGAAASASAAPDPGIAGAGGRDAPTSQRISVEPSGETSSH